MPKISVVIITLNEEKNIERCLKSVVDIADDIVVVDSYSTDKTEEICNKYNVRFVKHKFEGHIEQKNFAITQAKYPHILSLDADEALSEELQKSIAEVKNNWRYDGYYFNRLTNYCGKWIKHCGWYPDQKLRLWDSRKGRWGGQNPHDEFILENGAIKKFLKGDLLHFSYYSITGHIEQINKFSTIMANERFKKNQKVYLWDIFIKPIWKFVRDYYIKLGFLDGYYGLIICINSSYATFLKYIKLAEMYKNRKIK
jgi:glycosyltransferase involved in cell wall biosynthesis